MSSKRIRNVVTLEKKLEIIAIKKEKSQRLVAEMYDIPKSTI